MRSTNSRNFRTELRAHLDHATQEPVRIMRGSSETFVLMNEKQFSSLQLQVNDLQRRLLESMEELAKLKVRQK